MSDYVHALLDTLINRQSKILEDYPSDKKIGGDGRSAQFMIEWPDGLKTYDILFTNKNGVQWAPPGTVMRNQIWMTEDTFYQICMGTKDIKEAKDHDEIMIAGEHSLYDTIEIKNIWDMVRERILEPMLKVA